MIQYTISDFTETNPNLQQTYIPDTSLFGNYTERNHITQNTQNIQNINPTSPPSTINDRPWKISTKLKNLLDEFQQTILYDHPSTPCAYCSILMTNQAINWIDYNTSEEYTLPIAFPNIRIVTRINNRGKSKIAVCTSCKSEKTRRYPPILSPIPNEINAVPIIYRKSLSPIYMNCTLGRISGSNPYTNYRHLQGFINLSKNKHALELHSGLIGAFLNQEETSNWFHPTLIPASQ